VKYIKNLKKILKILTPKERKELKVIIILMIIGMFFETFGIAIIIPFISFLVDGNYIEKYPQIKPFMESIGNPSQETFIFIALGAFLLFYIIKNIYLIFLTWKQTKFSSKALANLSNRLFSLYIYQPYTFHLQHNSAELIRNVIGETFSFGKFSLQTTLSLFSELFVLSGILILLFIMQPIGTLIIFVIITLLGGSFYALSKKRLLKWGKKRQKLDAMRMQYLQQGLGGVKEIKLSGYEDNFLSLYHCDTKESTLLSQKLSFLNELPRFLIEIIMMTGLVALIVIIVIVDKSTDNILPVVGLFGMAAFRLMPSFNRILYALQNMKYGTPIVDLLYRDLTLLEQLKKDRSNKSFSFNNSIVVKNIYYRYPNSQKDVLSDISISIKKGTSIGFIGQSGAGKSTMVDIILGLLEPKDGDILVDNKSIYQDLGAWQKNIGYVPQSIFLTDDSLRKNIAFGLSDGEIDDVQVWKVLKMAQLDEFVKEQPEGLDSFVGERGVKLSGGQKQRIGIARALYHNPEVLILDEATSALDTETEKNFMHIINTLHGSKTIIIIAHRLSTVENCDYIYKFKDGKIIESGSYKQVLGDKI
jgi:ABC-type multidrug transport system fused ATPase/permease subunit